ncbi:MAG: peptidoglycan editing factor PgeF [Rubrivivax sp.]|nr:peptidoglycan editing factor PgeF [Rubrivivax sp.]
MPPETAGSGWLRPDWPAPAHVRALMSTRRVRPAAGGSDFDPGRDGTLPAAAANRRQLALELGAAPVWLRQVHGAEVVRVDQWRADAAPVADAAISATRGVACVVLVADCLPVLLCDTQGRAVAAAHAGWRGLAAGVLERSVDALCEAASCPPSALLAWLGPCIGPQAFEVGADVLEAFGVDPQAAPTWQAQAHFVRRDRPDGARRWLADLPALARLRLARRGVVRVSAGTDCTVHDASRFFSFRRDGAVGRMAAAITCID